MTGNGHGKYWSIEAQKPGFGSRKEGNMGLTNFIGCYTSDLYIALHPLHGHMHEATVDALNYHL